MVESDSRADHRPEYRTRRFVALGHDFACVTGDLSLTGYLDRVLDPFVAPGHAGSAYAVIDNGPDRSPQFALWYQDDHVADCATQSDVVGMLLWHINRHAVTATPGYLLLHAAGVVLDGDAVVLPGPSGAGKTTLVAGLVAAGFDYLSDEIVALDPDTGLAHAYPKPLALKESSWPLFSDLGPDEQDSPFCSNGRPWNLDPRRIRPDSIAKPATPRLVVWPRYDARGEASLTRLSSTEGVLRLAENAFNLELHDTVGLQTLTNVVRSAACYELVTGDLDDIGRLVRTLLHTEVAPPEGNWSMNRRPSPSGRTIEGHAVFGIKNSVTSATLDGDVILLDHSTASVHALNGAGAMVWSRLDGARCVEALVQEMSRQFGIDRATMGADVYALLAELRDRDLIELINESVAR